MYQGIHKTYTANVSPRRWEGANCVNSGGGGTGVVLYTHEAVTFGYVGDADQ